MGYVDLNTVHTPATGVKPPAAWGLQARDNDELAAKPYHAKVTRAAVQSIPNSTVTAITWTAKLYDTSPLGNLWVAGTPDRIIVPIAGLWGFTFSANFNINAVGIRLIYTSTPTVPEIGIYDTVGVAGWHVSNTVYGEARLAAGDAVFCYVFQGSGAALDAGTARTQHASVHLISL